jgi:DDE superfamily endonuclease
MFLQALSFIKIYIQSLSNELQQENQTYGLSTAQMVWFATCFMGILFTNSVSWEGFSRVSVGEYSKTALSKMCFSGKIAWNRLLICSTRMILKRFKVTQGVLVIDDKNHNRSKKTCKIFGVHKQKDKKTGGYSMGQNIVFLYLVTPYFCLPVSFLFYMPDPNLSKWAKDKALHKKQGRKEKFSPEPLRSLEHPKKYELAIQLLRAFAKEFPLFIVHTVLADALYGNKTFFSGVKKIFPTSQLISQLRKDQNVTYRNQKINIETFFKAYQGWSHKIIVRGGKTLQVTAGGSRLFVNAHKKKSFVVAMKYEGETDYRYLIADDLSWNMTEVMQEYTLRWLIEVFIEDWSCYCGYCSLAKQRGCEGSARPLILSLLFDHCFLLHPQQQSFIEQRQPLATLGSFINYAQCEALSCFISDIVNHENPLEYWTTIEARMKEVFCVLRRSSKHMNGRSGVFIRRANKNCYAGAA